MAKIVEFVMPFARKMTKFIIIFPVIALISGCAAPEVTSDFHDPFEAQNRSVHTFNKSIDRAVLGPVSQSYGEILPEPVRHGVSNFAANLALPGAVVNDLLQLNLEDAVHNTMRFLVNSTIGIGGIFDPAAQGGVLARESDFGETLHVWGFNEGAYVELPILGPSTSRDAAGMLGDLFLDPINTLVPAPERYLAPIAYTASKVGDRYRFAATFNSIYYDSADSYAQARLLYLESRRFDLGIEAEEDDLYEGLYDDILGQ